jgi:DNA-binding NarL/FixJ family response regulator
MTNILLVDDHAVVRAGLRAILESTGKSVFVEEASCFDEAMSKVRRGSWDAVILDVTMPGKSGLETLRHIKKENSSLPVLMLSVHSDQDYGVRALKAGASGYLDKSAAPERLLDAITKILAGRRYVSPEFGENLAAQVVGETGQDSHQILTDREFEVFRLIAAGVRTAEIAEILSISPKTVHSHRRNILKKLGLNSNADMVRYAYEHHLVE